MAKTQGKRPGPSLQRSAKKQKLADNKASGKSNGKSKAKGRERAFERDTIPIPQATDGAEDDAISEQDLEFFAEATHTGGFLEHLDEKGIARSKKETERLHRLSKPKRKDVKDDLPPMDSHDEDEDEEPWSSGMEDSGASFSGSDEEDVASESELSILSGDQRSDSDVEMPYEALPRKRRQSWDPAEEKGVKRLPIKLADGQVQYSKEKIIPRGLEDSSEEDSVDEHETARLHMESSKVEDVSTGARFGRAAVVDIIGKKSRKARIQGAREQIANICQEIVSDPENSLGLLRRLHTFSLPEISTPSHPEPVPNDILVRKLAFLSQLAVFKDIIPGYRIRPLTDIEKAEKVSQMVQRTRDFEQGLVSVYQSHLRVLEAELKAKSDLAGVALQCICRLLVDVTHFNFRANLMAAVVARLSKKSWDESSDLCLDTLISILRADRTGQPSLELVRLLNRMIKERRFTVHPNVLSCLLQLRLKTELGGVRASDAKAERDAPAGGTVHSKGRAAARRAKGRDTAQPHLSKKAQKKRKETRAIEVEMREAEAEVDREERASVHTETLKLVFVLYFRILKNPRPTSLLPAALQGIARFAHLVNVDFFKDLMQVLKDLIARADSDADTDENAAARGDGADDARAAGRAIGALHLRLQCIVTAFELLTGQGEALNIDLHDFVARLYALILPLSMLPGAEAETEAPVRAATAAATATASTPGTAARTRRSAAVPGTPADALFRALELAFGPLLRTAGAGAGTRPPPARTAAFAKRLLNAALHLPPASAARALGLVRALLSAEPALAALLPGVDADAAAGTPGGGGGGRAADGVYRADIDDPQLCNAFAASFWELRVLARAHVDPHVRQLADEVASFTSAS